MMSPIPRDVWLGAILGAPVGLLFLPTHYLVWRWTWRVSPFTSTLVTSLLGVVTTSIAFGVMFLGLSLPASPFVTDWPTFVRAYVVSFLVCGLIVRLVIDRRERSKRGR
jgi:large-conductance mechanosensitive channel